MKNVPNKLKVEINSYATGRDYSYNIKCSHTAIIIKAERLDANPNAYRRLSVEGLELKSGYAVAQLKMYGIERAPS